MKTIQELLAAGPVLGDGGYLIELERRGYVDSGSGREKVGTGRGSGNPARRHRRFPHRRRSRSAG